MEFGVSSASGQRNAARNHGSILVGVLWCLALLSIIVIGVLHTARTDLTVTKNYGDRIQAHYLALAGVEKAKALLLQDAMERRRTGKNHTSALYDAPEEFRDISLGRGDFRVFHHGSQEEGGGTVYGISDQESRLNVNYAQPDELSKLPGISPDTVAAIIDWRDPDNNLTPGGAEAEYYSALRPPYLPRNSQLLTIRELLMVRGVSSDLLFGDDQEQNGFLDAESDAASGRGAGALDGGWSDLLTVDSWIRNVNAGGDRRINIQMADENTLSSVKGITADIARAIVAYRGQKQFESIGDLLDVTRAQNQRPARGRVVNMDTGTGSADSKVIDEKLLMEIADDLTAVSQRELAGPVNINTASAAVLACLPGMTPELAQAIVTFRTANGPFENIAWLLKVPDMSRDMFKQVAARVSARSETFRIVSEGKVASSGARQRVEVVVHLGEDDVETLSYREDL